MATNPEIVDRLTNALQLALMLPYDWIPISSRPRDAAQLVEAVSKTASPAHELRPDANKRG